MRRQRGAGARRGWLVAGLLAVGCGGDGCAGGCGSEDSTPAPVVTSPSPALAGKVEPAPESERALGRAVFEALQRDDWEGYTNLLATRGDMMGLYAGIDRSDGHQRRKRRRMVWRRINRLRDGEAEEGWKTVRRTAELEGVDWAAATLVEVRREEVGPERLPPGTEAAEVQLVLEQDGVQRVLSVGACVRAKRGWVSLYPLAWQG